MALQIITPPAVEPFTVAEAKLFLNIDYDDRDTLIELYIKAARFNAEHWTGRALVTQTLELTLDEFPEAEIKLPRPPLQSVSSVKYDDGDGAEQTLDASAYAVDTASLFGRVVFTGSTWPTTVDGINAVRIRYIAGYAPAADSPADLATGIPEDIKHGMRMVMAHMFEHHEDVVIGSPAQLLPNGSRYFWAPNRVHLDFA